MIPAIIERFIPDISERLKERISVNGCTMKFLMGRGKFKKYSERYERGEDPDSLDGREVLEREN